MEKLTQTDSRVNNISATLEGLLLPILNDISTLGSRMDDMARYPCVYALQGILDLP